MNTQHHYNARQHAAAHTESYLFHQLIPYIGSKRKLLPLIEQAISQTGVVGGRFVDFFAGSGVVARLAKLRGFAVLANDWEPYTMPINQCYIGCNTLPLFAQLGGIQNVFSLLNSLPPQAGYLATHYCPADDEQPDPANERMFFTHRNGARLDAIREQIAAWCAAGQLDADEQAVLLAALLYAACYVSNTSGVFKGFHHGWGGRTGTALYRIRSDLLLRIPRLHNNLLLNQVTQQDAQQLAGYLRNTGVQIDIAYLDPPYNQHPYASNYHLLNTLTLWDKPALSPQISAGDKAAIRRDWRDQRRSAYNHATATAAYAALLATIDARFILTSYSTDGNIPLPALLAAAAARGALTCVKLPYKRYRVSTPRMSAKPLNVEFVLIIDTSQPGSAAAAGQLSNDILQAEAQALDAYEQGA